TKNFIILRSETFPGPPRLFLSGLRLRPPQPCGRRPAFSGLCCRLAAALANERSPGPILLDVSRPYDNPATRRTDARRGADTRRARRRRARRQAAAGPPRESSGQGTLGLSRRPGRAGRDARRRGGARAPGGDRRRGVG